MNANSKKVMEKSVEKSVLLTKQEAPTSVSTTIEESSGGTKDAPKSAGAINEGSLGGTKEAPKSVAAIIEKSSGGTKDAPKSTVATNEGSSGDNKEASNSSNSSIEESLRGTKEALLSLAATIGSLGCTKKSTEKLVATTLENANRGNKALNIKPRFDIGPKAGTSNNKDKNLSAPSAAKKLFTVSEKKDGHSTNLKRRFAHFRNICVQENEDSLNKKLKTPDKEEALDGMQLKFVESLVQQKVRLMPQPKVDQLFIENALGVIEAMSRREVNDLALQKMIYEQKAKSEFEYMRTQLVNSENTLATYRRKIAELSQQFNELDTMRAKTSASRILPLVLKTEPHAAASMLPASSGILGNSRPSNGPKQDGKTPIFLKKRSFSVPVQWVKRGKDSFHVSRPFGRSELAKTDEKAATSSTNKIATPKAKPAKASTNPGQAANNTSKKTPQ